MAGKCAVMENMLNESAADCGHMSATAMAEVLRMKKIALLLAIMLMMLSAVPVMAEDVSLTGVPRATHTIRDSGVKITLPSGSFVVSFDKLTYQSTSAWYADLRADGFTVGATTSDGPCSAL